VVKDTCPTCGTRLLDAAAFCHRCGTRLRKRSDSVQLQQRKQSRRRRRAAVLDSSHRMVPVASSRGDSGPTRIRDRRRSFPDSADDAERTLWSDTFSAKAMIHVWFAAAIISVLAPIVVSQFTVDAQVRQWLFVGLAAGWLGLILYLGFRKLDAHYELTTQRFLHEHGILTRRTHRIEVIDIDDVTVRQSIIERMVDVGTIELISSDETDPVFELVGIDRVRHVAELLDSARREERLRRGLHIESV
jgi:hypothetical protein